MAFDGGEHLFPYWVVGQSGYDVVFFGQRDDSAEVRDPVGVIARTI